MLTFPLFYLALLPVVTAFDISANTNLAIYWGQDSSGASYPNDSSKWQKPLGDYCNDNNADMILIAFLNQFNTTGGLPSIDLANSCTGTYFPGTSLLNCSFLAPEVEKCQKAGKAITLSLGGATGATGLQSDQQGKAFAQIIWDLFLGGQSNTRPFGNAVLDGIDMDIEGGAQTGFVAFLTSLRALMSSGNKRYYITAAPQCPFPDAYIGNTLNSFGFDAVLVQFYNNDCGLQNFNSSNAWNFGTWDNWAKNTSPNKNVKVYIGAPASSVAAGSGYVDASSLANIISKTRSTYTSFGGVMLWDMSQAYANSRYDAKAKAALTSSGSLAQCMEVPAWQSNVVYLNGDQVAYNGHLWTAKWWSYNDLPRSFHSMTAMNVWADEGACDASSPMTFRVQSEDAAQAFFDDPFRAGYIREE